MKSTLALVIITTSSFLLDSCLPDSKNRKNHKRTLQVCGNLYAETYCVFGQGGWGGDRDSKWLTDSTNFRIYLGSYDEIYGGFDFRCTEDSIYVTQKPDNITGNPTQPTTIAYKLSDLTNSN